MDPIKINVNVQIGVTKELFGLLSAFQHRPAPAVAAAPAESKPGEAPRNVTCKIAFGSRIVTLMIRDDYFAGFVTFGLRARECTACDDIHSRNRQSTIWNSQLTNRYDHNLCGEEIFK